MLCCLQEADPCTLIMRTYTEEGKKVERNGGPKHPAVFVRVPDAVGLARCAAADFWSFREDDTNDDDHDEAAAGAVPPAPEE